MRGWLRKLLGKEVWDERATRETRSMAPRPGQKRTGLVSKEGTRCPRVVKPGAREMQKSGAERRWREMGKRMVLRMV
jgi:hypothetical protein